MLRVLWSSWQCARCDWKASDHTADDFEALGLVRLHIDAHDLAALDRRALPPDGPSIGPDVPGGGAI